MDNERGLYVKYEVKKAEDGALVNECFVLRPDRDPHARAALKAYADSCTNSNPALASDILYWLHTIENPEPGIDEDFLVDDGVYEGDVVIHQPYDDDED